MSERRSLGRAGSVLVASLALSGLGVGGQQEPASRGVATSAAKDERASLDRAYDMVRQRRFAEARASLAPVVMEVRRALQASEGDPKADPGLRGRLAEVLFAQGLIEARLGSRSDALRLLEQADGLGFPPVGSPLMRLAAECLGELQHAAAAVQAWREVVRAAPEDLEARVRLGAALHGAGRPVEAESVLREALRRDPSLPGAEFFLGAALFEQRHHEAAVHLERELQRDPRCSGCMSKLAHLAYLAGDDAACSSWLARAHALDPDYLETNLVYGLLYNRTGRPELAVRHLTLVVERAPSHATARYQLAIAYQRSGQAEKAREQREVYDRLTAERKARENAIRGAEP